MVVPRARQRFQEVFGRAPDGAVFSPGRVNLVGEHTDYNDGFVLPMAIDRGIALAFAPRADDVLRVHSAELSKTRDLRLDQVRERVAIDPGRHGRRGGWFAYIAGVAWAMMGSGREVRGADIALVADLPMGAGLSSSAALEVGVARVLSAVSGFDWDPKAAALVALQAEREFAGVACGIMDQLVVAAAKEGSAVLIDCRSLETRDIPLPGDMAVVIFDSGVSRDLASSEYNARRASCDRAVAVIRGKHPEVAALRDVDFAMLEESRPAMDAVDYLRALHVVGENPRPAAMSAALEAGALASAGRIVRDSHASLRDLYAVSTPELDALVSAADAHPGCHGARLTGAGFGGSIVAIAETAAVDGLVAAVTAQYAAQCGRETRAIVSRASAGARLVG